VDSPATKYMKAHDLKIKNSLLRAITLAIIVALIAVFAVRSIPMIRIVENFLYDFRINYASSPIQISSDIVIVAITEQTLASFPYRTPVDRQFLSDLLLDLENKAVNSIAFDLLFDQPTEPVKDRNLQTTFNLLTVPLIFASAGFENSLLPAQQQYLEQFTKGFAKGSAVVFRDSNDGVVRAAPIGSSAEKPSRPGFAAAIADALDIDIPDVSRLAIDYKEAANQASPLYVIYPAHTVSLLPKSWLTGKNILIGVMLDLEDRLETPLSRLSASTRQVSGIEIHAQLLAQLQDNRFIRQMGLLSDIAISVLVGLLGLYCFSGHRHIRRPLSIVFSLFVLIWIGSVFLFYQSSLMISLLPPSITLALISAFSVIQNWRKETTKRQFIQGAFSKYMSHNYVDQLIANPDQLKVSGEKREVTFLFTDLAGFTGLTERLDPEDMVTLINQYLDGACEIVIRHGGMVASIVGDALHVMFNAPMFQPDHAQRALNAAIELDEFCRNFETLQQAKGVHIEMTRIGVNTGDCILGNFGGNNRIEYTAMGEAINTAARLESVNKHIGTRICISDSVREKSSGVTFRPIGCLILKGMTRKINAFEPVQLNDPKLADYDQYLEVYRKIEAKEADALATLQNLYRDFSSDPLVSFHLSRLQSGETGTTIVMMDK
jgi:adenylate cyclase